MALIPESPYSNIQRAASILTSINKPVTDQDVIELILAGHLHCYAWEYDYRIVHAPDGTQWKANGQQSNAPRLLLDAKKWDEDRYCRAEICVTWPGRDMYDGRDGEPVFMYTEPAENKRLKIEDILVSTEEVRKLLSVVTVQTADEQTHKNAAATALKALQTADIDKQIDAVIQKIDAAVRDHIRSKKSERVINHILFLKEAGLSNSDRAKNKVKAFIEKDYSYIGYSAISRRPAAKGGYFVNS